MPMNNPIEGELARAIEVVVLDVDGVMTDGGVYLGQTPSGEPVEMKRFDVQDGLGVKMLTWAGIEVAIVSGRASEATTQRAIELGITECHQDPAAEKLPIVENLLERTGAGWSALAVMGDDLADLPLFAQAALPVAVANAVQEVRDAAVWTTTRPGGHGAVREFAKALLEARGLWGPLVKKYVHVRSAKAQ